MYFKRIEVCWNEVYILVSTDSFQDIPELHSFLHLYSVIFKTLDESVFASGVKWIKYNV